MKRGLGPQCSGIKTPQATTCTISEGCSWSTSQRVSVWLAPSKLFRLPVSFKTPSPQLIILQFQGGGLAFWLSFRMKISLI